MSFSPSFSVTQNVVHPTWLYLTDDSTGTDGSIASRRITASIYDGTYLTPTGTTTDYISWALADTTTTPDILAKDYTVHLTVKWVDSGGNMLHEAEKWASFDLNGRLGLFSQCKKAISNPRILQDRNYTGGLMQAFVYLAAAKDAALFADLFKGQSALDKCKEMMDNPTKYF